MCARTNLLRHLFEDRSQKRYADKNEGVTRHQDSADARTEVAIYGVGGVGGGVVEVEGGWSVQGGSDVWRLGRMSKA